MGAEPSTTSELITPALLVDVATFDRNLAAMDAVLPGSRLRPHVKAFKSTDIAKRLDTDGHHSFCAATPREIEGLVAAGLTEDLLLANETLDTGRLGALDDQANITVAIDSDETLDAAIAGGVRSVLVQSISISKVWKLWALRYGSNTATWWPRRLACGARKSFSTCRRSPAPRT